MNDFFYKPVKNSRQDMITFLKNHFRYYTLNPWNVSTSYANNIKLPHLGLPGNINDKAYDFLSADCEEYNIEIEAHISEFEKETGYDIGFNGRSGGYLVLYDKNRPGQPIDQYDDFDELSKDELKERVKLVQTFDRCCDRIRDSFIWYVEHADIRDEPFTVTYTKRVAHIPEDA